MQQAILIVADGNLSPSTFTTLAELAHTHQVPLFFEPTSDHKCTLPIVTGMLGYVDIIKPNLSELCAIVSMCLDRDLIMEGRAAVVHALGSRRSRRVNHNDTGGKKGYILEPYAGDSLMEMDLTDVRILASSLQLLMVRHAYNLSRNKNEEKVRVVHGKHVIVSLGERGVLWVGPQSSSTSSGHIPTNGSRRDGNDSIGPAPFLHVPAIPLQVISTPSSNLADHDSTTINTSGAGDAFCAGVIYDMCSFIPGKELHVFDDDGKSRGKGIPKGLSVDSIHAGLKNAHRTLHSNTSTAT